jgi:predicted O-methyltransferase YrrM
MIAMTPHARDTHLHAMRAQALADSIPVISTQNAVFLSQLLSNQRPARVLEIGSAIGVSSAVIALCAQQWGGTLTTIEISVPTQAAAQANLNALGLRNVHSLCGDARALIAQWAQAGEAPFDCVFIDAQKSQTHVFYEAALSLFAPDGVVIVDDVWKYRQKMLAFYTLLAQKKQAYSLHFVDGADATMVIRPGA